MFLALALAVVGGTLGTLRGGSLDSLSRTKLRWWGLLVLGLGLQLLFGYWQPAWLNRAAAVATVLSSNAAIAVFVWANRHLPGMLLVGAGLLLNVIVIAANGAMPVSPGASRIAHVPRSLSDPGIKHERLDSDTALPWLGDVIPVPRLGEVMSVGDVVLAVGLGVLVYTQTKTAKPKSSMASEASG
jgi:hypothetical protein